MNTISTALRRHISFSSFLTTGFLSALSLASYLYNLASANTLNSRNDFLWLLILQSIAGFMSTLVTILCTPGSGKPCRQQKSSRSVHEIYLVLFLIVLIWLYPIAGSVVATSYMAALGALVVINGHSTLQMPLYSLMSAAYSLQLLLSNAVNIEFISIRIGISVCLLLVIDKSSSLPSILEIFSTTSRQWSVVLICHAIGLSINSAMNLIAPILLFQADVYAKILNLSLRTTFVAETVLLGKILHKGDIRYANLNKSPSYIVLVFFLLFAISTSTVLVASTTIQSQGLNAIYAILSDRTRLLMSFTISLAIALFSIVRLFYAFSYYSLASKLTVISANKISTKISGHATYLFLAFWVLYALFFLLASSWEFKLFMLLLPPVTSLIYLRFQIKRPWQATAFATR
jgi:hypothetical protein